MGEESERRLAKRFLITVVIDNGHLVRSIPFSSAPTFLLMVVADLTIGKRIQLYKSSDLRFSCVAVYSVDADTNTLPPDCY